jgi:8-oxo-dGTP pyrophosphatase MutT (NUDIX family)
LIRPIFDPELLPVESTGAGLAQVASERLSAAGLRLRFGQTLGWTPEPSSEEWRASGDPRQAAVLVPLVTREDGLTVMLTQRTDHLADHAGQVSFPGGRREPDDLDASATALREAAEEVGLGAQHVEVLGTLPDYLTGTGFRVSPVVALVHPPFEVTADEFEVAEIFEVPLAFLMDPAHHEVRVFRWEGGERRFFAMPYARPGADGHYFIWGATAGMLRNLYRFLAA